MTPVALLVGALILPCVLYAYVYGSSLPAWGMIRDGKSRLRGGVYRSYREAPPIQWVEGRAPLVVRFAAFTSFCLGQLLLPAIAGAPLGILIALGTWVEGQPEPLLLGLAVAGPTGILVSARVLGAGIALLERAPHAAERARLAAKWELGQNLVFFGFLCVLFVTSRGDDGEVLAISGLVAAFNLLAILHAGLLFAAANALDSYDAAAEAIAPVEIPA